jgi:hypothetical protein
VAVTLLPPQAGQARGDGDIGIVGAAGGHGSQQQDPCLPFGVGLAAPANRQPGGEVAPQPDRVVGQRGPSDGGQQPAAVLAQQAKPSSGLTQLQHRHGEILAVARADPLVGQAEFVERSLDVGRW